MKSALILLVAGLVGCNQLFSPGQEYVYQYYGRMLTGIPELDSHYAGLALQAKVVVQAKSQNNYKVQMKDVKYGTYNEQLSSSNSVENWRNVNVEANTPLSGEQKQMLESPVEFQIQQGQISVVKVSSQEPQWSVNMKKALISSLKIQLPQQQLEQQQNQERVNPKMWYIQQQQQQQQQQQMGQSYWTVMEEGIEGKCQNTYQVSELPEYMINEYEQGMLKPELCQGKKYWQLLRTRDITKCQDSSIFLSSKGHKNCLEGNCEDQNTKQTQTRYFGCGENLNDIQLHGMINEGEMRQAVVAFNVEEVVTGTKQVLKLQQIQSISNEIPEVQSPKTCADLSYEYPQVHQTKKSVSSRQEQQEYFKSLTKQPKSASFIPEILDDLNSQELKSQIVQKLQKIAEEIENVEHFAEKEIPNQLKALKTVVSVMKTEDIKEMFQTVKSLSSSSQQQQIVRNLFLDIVRNSGSPPAIMFLKEMIEQEQLTEVENYMVIVTLSHYMKAPSEEMIQQVFQLIKSSAVQKRFWLKGSANMIFANIVRNACLGSSTAVYPENIFGKMCSENNQKISEEYIPYLLSELKNAQTSSEKMVSLYALGQLGHESVLPLIVSYIEGKTQDSTTQLRKTALYSLSDVANQYRHKLLPVFLAIAQNPAESRTLRLPAIALVMRCQPETAQLQKLAVSTWFEQDQEVSKFIYTVLKELAQLNRESHPQGSYLKPLSQKAKTVLHLAKPMSLIVSTNKINSGYLRELDIGAYMLNSLMQGTTSTEIYHKTEYFLKQVQTTPMEFSVHYAGVQSVARSLMESFDESARHSPRRGNAFEAGAWLRLSDDINFAVEFSEEQVQDLKRKVVRAVRESGLSALKNICGETPINHQNVFEELPYQALVASDLGLPIIVETQMTYFYSLQGKMNIECSYNKPSASLEMTNKMSYTYNGYAGTVCPFTQELLAAGINIHRSTNLPTKTNIEVEPTSGQLKISMTQNEQVSSNSQAIDVHHYHVKPYTVQKPLVFKDLTHSMLHQNTKVIRSSASQKRFSASFGESLGLDMSVMVETECDLYDAKTMMDSWAIYNYNPIAASWFSSFSETALKADGTPTARFHEYTLSHNPSRSSTKGAEMTVQLTLASKSQDEESKKIMVKSDRSMTSQRLQQSSKTDQKIEDCLRKIDSKNAYALNAHVTAQLTGGQSKTYTYSITAGAGQNTLEHKWNLHLENDEQHSLKRVCVDGQMRYPSSPSSEAKFQYSNKVQFGQTCDQYYVNVEGNSQVSYRQRSFASESDESRQCQKASEQEKKLRNEIKYLSEESEERNAKAQEHSEWAENKLRFCSKKSEQSRTIDETQITITYSQDLPRSVYNSAKSANGVMKALLLQYISEISQPSQNNKIQINLNFNPKINTVDVKVQSPEENVVLRNIRVPQQLREICPFVAGQNPIEQTYKALTGSPLLGKCVLGQGYVQTFDKKTYSYQVDECDHLLSSDCSERTDHGIFAKEVNGQKHVTIYEGKTKVEVRPSEAYSQQVEKFTIVVDGQEVPLKKNEKIILSSRSPLDQVTAYWSNDNVVEINTPHNRVQHQGKTVIVEEKTSADGSHCGLCGDYNQDRRADLKSPKGCIFKSRTLLAKSYRSKSAECSPLSQRTQEQIREEEERCIKFDTKKTDVKQVFETEQHWNTKTIKRHSYIYQEDKICISQEPVIQCSHDSIPEGMRKKTVSYVCLPEGRVAKLYAERIERGESPQELKHQPVAFKAEMEQPTSCKLQQI